MTATDVIYRSALETRVLELLDRGPLTANELIRETGLTYNVLYRLLERVIDLGEVKAEDARLLGYRGKGRRKYVYSRVGR